MSDETISNTEQHEYDKPNQLVVIIMGSESDSEHAGKITNVLDRFGVGYEIRIGSAHKTPEHVLGIVKGYNEEKDKDLVFIAVAGRSNALGGFIDASTTYPVINAPPPGAPHTIFSSLDMPSGIAAVTVLRPETAALAAVKIFALSNPTLQSMYEEFLKSQQEKIIQADLRVHLA